MRKQGKKVDQFKKECDRLIESRLANLRARTFEELEQLEAFRDEQLKIGTVAVSLITSKQLRDPHEVKVIVEVFWKTLILLTHSERKGFAMTEKGDVRELLRKEYG
jgi:hypothetical protein